MTRSSAVSIVIPCYNAEKWVVRAIQSALDQTGVAFEVIVIDDGSTDGSLDVIRKFGDRIRWESGPNRGGGAARNRLMELARCEWLQFLDADDWLMPEKVASQAKVLESDPETDIIYGPSIIEHHGTLGVERKRLSIPEPHDPWILLARWWLPQTGAPLWRRQALMDVGGWKEDQPCCQEHELYLRLLIAGKTFRYHPTSGSVYRRFDDGTLSTRDMKLVRRERMKIEQRLEDHLRATGQLRPERQRAINIARFEMARSSWPEDHAEARRIHATIRATQPGFRPDGPAGPWAYRMAYSVFGFEAAERIASARRAVRLSGAS